MNATMTVLGLYNFDPTLFDGLRLPDSVSRETLIDNLLMECAELECLYSSAPFCKYAFGTWSVKQLPNWERELNALTADYNPLENYDRKEDYTDTENGDSKGNSKSTGKSTATSISSATAFDTNQFKDTGKGTDNGNSEGTSEGANDYRRNLTRQGRIHGNIGVTTSQQMLESELTLRQKYNIYDIIVSDFKKRFCLLVY